jgi:F0F1-type ATP synthase membrane subunit b/b'
MPTSSILATFDLTSTDLWMIVGCTVAFTVFIDRLGKILISPLVRLHEARELATVGASVEAATLESAAITLQKEIEQKVLDARAKAFSESESAIVTAKKEASVLISGAEADAARSVAAARQAVHQELTAARQKAISSISQLAQAALTKVAEEVAR